MQKFFWARVFLGLNAGFSTLTGLALILFYGPIIEAMFIEPKGWMKYLFIGTGVGFQSS